VREAERERLECKRNRAKISHRSLRTRAHTWRNPIVRHLSSEAQIIGDVNFADQG
jgi:hypothetical protein